MSIKFFVNDSQSLENYLNKKVQKGYILKSMTPFIPFPPLVFTSFNFERGKEKQRIYRVDSRKLKKEDLIDYNQLFLDDGWNSFSGAPIHNHLHIFYSDDPKITSIYSSEQSLKERNQKDAFHLLTKGCLLVMFFVILSTLFPLSFTASNGIVGFVLHNFYIIVAVLWIVYALIKYLKEKRA